VKENILATIFDVARRTCVSTTTVFHVLNDTCKVNDDLSHVRNVGRHSTAELRDALVRAGTLDRGTPPRASRT
jgi:hypothetical protein